jgi:hypothetical protein
VSVSDVSFQVNDYQDISYNREHITGAEDSLSEPPENPPGFETTSVTFWGAFFAAFSIFDALALTHEDIELTDDVA